MISVNKLHSAVKSGDIREVRHLCKFIPEYMIGIKDQFGRTALHYAKNKQIAQSLVECVDLNRRVDFILSIDNDERTALHAAVGNGRADVVEYLCSISLADINDVRNTLEHRRALTLSKYSSQILAPKSLSEAPHAENMLLLKRDKDGRTALHYAVDMDTARLLVESVEPEIRTNFILAADDYKQTVLHVSVVEGRTDVVEYFSSMSLPNDELLLMKDVEDRTALHLTDDALIAEILVNSVNQKAEFVQCEDYAGHRALISNTELLSALLEYLETECADTDDLKFVLEGKSARAGNLFHRTASSSLLNFEQNFSVLMNFIAFADVGNVMSVDQQGHTPVDYLIYRSSTKVLAETLDSMPLVQRRRCISQTNISKLKNGTRPCTIELVGKLMRQRLNITSIEEDIFKIVLYSLNEYSLLDPYYLISWRLFAEYTANIVSASSLAVKEHRRSFEKLPTNKPPSMLWIHLDRQCLQTNPCKSTELRRSLLECERPEYHGVGKVVVVSSPDGETQLVPPGPDYIIITSCDKEADNLRSQQRIGTGQYPISNLIEQLRELETVEQVEINSTLCRRYLGDVLHTTCDQTLISGDDRGKALIICNRKARDEGWKSELRDAETVLKKQFGLHVVIKYDQSTSGILSSIAEFSHSEGHKSLVALAIMSHGGDGSISANDLAEKCSVQSVIDSLCTEQLKKVPKVVLLSFCRGGLLGNRMKNSFECTELPKLTGGSPAVDTQSPSMAQRAREWNSNPFPKLSVPESCYVCFSTLPDSKWLSNWHC